MSGRPAESGRTSLREFGGAHDWSEFRSVASLHAHTHYSRETLSDVPQHIIRIPVIGKVLERELKAYEDREGCAIDFSKGWWHPPVSPRAVFESEAAQIEARFDLAPLVSITDHDDISAGLELQTLYALRRAPVSFEWTVPFGRGFFHLGIHNLPVASACEWFSRLSAITAQPSVEAVGGALADLDALPDVLVVFNHPRWDLAEVGRHEHARSLRHFLACFRTRLHALELNGYRSWKENASVRPIAEATGLPLISGGDRHATDPNAILNLTRAQSFGEFVADVRAGVSHIVVMPEYRRHLATRILSSASDVLRRYGSYPAGRQHWTDRVSWDMDGSVRTLSFHWRDGGPFWVRSAIGALQLIASPVVLPVIRAALEASDAVIARTMLLTMPRRTPRRYALRASSIST